MHLLLRKYNKREGNFIMSWVRYNSGYGSGHNAEHMKKVWTVNYKNAIDRLIIRRPIIGNLLKDLNISQLEFCRRLNIKYLMFNGLNIGTRYRGYSIRDIRILEEVFMAPLIELYPDIIDNGYGKSFKKPALVFYGPDIMEKFKNEHLCLKEIENSKDVKTLMSILTDREKFIIKCRFGFFGFELMLEDIGKLFDLTRERIRQIEYVALTKMRNKTNNINVKIQSFINSKILAG